MKRSTTFAVAAAALTVLALGVARQGRQRANAAEAARARMAARRQEVENLSRRAQASIAFAAPSRPSQSGTPSKAAGPMNRKSEPEDSPGLHKLLADPAMQSLYLAARRANLKYEYGPLYRALGLTEEQRRQFEDLVSKREEEALDVASTVPEAIGSSYLDGRLFSRHPFLFSPADPAALSGDAGANSDAQAAIELLRQSEAAYEDGIRRLLGDTGVAQVATYDRSALLRDVTDSMGARLASRGEPLAPAQADQLRGLLDESTVSRDGTFVGPQDVDWDQVMAKAPAILTPSQLSALHNLAAPFQAGRAFERALQSSAAWGGPGGGR